MADIKDKISKLLALAESPNENEAKMALLKARELMAQYKLTPDEIKREKSEVVKREVLDIKCTKMTNDWIPTLSSIIASHYCCKVYLYREQYSKTSQIGLIGLEDDFEICKKIISYAVECVLSGTRRIKKDPYDTAGMHRKNCNAYGWGFAKGLREAYEKQAEQHQEWGLVMVVPSAVTDEIKNLCGNQKPKPYGSGRCDRDSADFARSGYEAGKSFDPRHRIGDGDGFAPALTA